MQNVHNAPTGGNGRHPIILLSRRLGDVLSYLRYFHLYSKSPIIVCVIGDVANLYNIFPYLQAKHLVLLTSTREKPKIGP